MTAMQIVQDLEPFADDDGETFVQVAVEGAEEPEQIPIESATGYMIVRSILAEHKERGLPTDHEVRSMVEVAKGLAYRRSRRPSSLAGKHLIAQSPLAQAVIHVAKDGGTRSELSRLLAKVNHVARREGIDTTGKRWPKSEDALGCQLSAIQKLLTAAGVPIARNENDRPRTWTIPPLTSGDGDATKVAVATCDRITSSGGPDTSRPSQGVRGGQVNIKMPRELNDLIQEVVDERK